MITSYNNSKWSREDDYTMRYEANKILVNLKFRELKKSNKFLYDGYSLITPILDSQVCYFVSKEEGYLELKKLDDCISYNEEMEIIHYYDLLNNGDKNLKLDITADELNIR